MGRRTAIIGLLLTGLSAAPAARAEAPAPDHPLFEPPSRWYGPHAVRHAADAFAPNRHADPDAAPAMPPREMRGLAELHVLDVEASEPGLFERLKGLAQWRTPWGRLKLALGSGGSATLQFRSSGAARDRATDPAAEHAPDLDLDEPLVPRLGAVRID